MLTETAEAPPTETKASAESKTFADSRGLYHAFLKIKNPYSWLAENAPDVKQKLVEFVEGKCDPVEATDYISNFDVFDRAQRNHFLAALLLYRHHGTVLIL
jgi:hypothetical protein